MKTKLKHPKKLVAVSILSLELLLLTSFSLFLYDPRFFIFREYALWIIPTLILVPFLILLRTYWEKRIKLYLNLSLLLLIPFAIYSFQIFNFSQKKSFVLAANETELQSYGEHFIIGYSDYEEIKTLVNKKAIGGIFLAAKNVQNKSKEDIAKEIDALQEIRKGQGLEPLFISTDQEGGIVSRVSPPLETQDSLKNTIKDLDRSEMIDKVRNYASQQATGLKEIGVNMNFAPVVDIDYGTKIEGDLYSMISNRAISDDPNIISLVSKIYCEEMLKKNILCVFKHFPGLGTIDTDTHLGGGNIRLSKTDLENKDWFPYLDNKTTIHGVMVSHAVLDSVDPENPSSISFKTVKPIIRQQFEHNGIVITDDMSMGAIMNDKIGIEKATLGALKASDDFILISYDHDLYYSAMFYLINQNEKDISLKDLEESKIRIKNTKVLIGI